MHSVANRDCLVKLAEIGVSGINVHQLGGSTKVVPLRQNSMDLGYYSGRKGLFIR